MSVLIAFGLFLAAMVTCVITGVDLVVALVWGIALFSLIGLRRGHTLRELWAMMWREGRKLVGVLGIFMFIGAITALWRSCGTIAFFIYHGVQIITPSLFVLVAFLLTCLLSYALGTSFGVVGTAGIILMALARSGGVDVMVTAGAVMSGAYFGDRCSPASSSASLVAAVTETKLYDNLRNMHKTGTLPLLLSIGVYAFLSVRHPIQSVDHGLLEALTEYYDISLWTLAPAVLMLVLPLVRLPIRETLVVSSLTAFAVSVFVQDMGVWETLYAAVLGYTPHSEALASVLSGGGVVSMLLASVSVMATGLFAGLLSGIGVLDGIRVQVGKLAEKWGLYGVTTLVSLAAGMIFCNQSIMVMMSQPLVAETYEKKGASRERLAIDMENSAIILAAVIPWNLACSIPHEMLGAGPGAVPYTVLMFMIPLCHALTGKWLMGEKRERTT